MSVFNPELFKGKVVFCTGGATGIGFGICTNFGKHGAKIAIMGRRVEKLEEAVEAWAKMGITARGYQGDVRLPATLHSAVEQCVKDFGRIDVLVNNAAGNFMCSAEDLSPKGFNTVLAIDLNGSFNAAKAAFPHLKRSGREGGAVIINITATLQYKACPFQVHAAAAKAGIDSITRTLGVEWAEYGIRCVGIAPGPIAGTVGGPGGRVFKALLSGAPETKEEIMMTVPLGRYGQTDDIANAAMFLASPAGSFITAETLVVDGGQWHGTSPMYHKMKAMLAKPEKGSQKSNL